MPTKMNLTPDNVEEIAEEVAEKTVTKLFLAFGFNSQDPNEVIKFQKDLSHLRAWRESTEAVKRRGLMAAVSFIVTGVLGYFLYGLFK